MDPFSLAAGIASLAAFSSSSLLLVQNFVKSIETIKQLEREVLILHQILEECAEMVREVSSLPPSVQSCISLCIERQRDLLELLDRYTSNKKSKRLKMILFAFREQELMTSYHAFRDSVLLLRDLSSDSRMNLRLVQMGLAMAQLSSEYEDEELDDGHDSVNEDGGPLTIITGPNLSTGETQDYTVASKRKKHRAFFAEFLTLMSRDWTRSVILIFEIQGGLKFVPARNKVDTGSAENFVSLEFLTKHGIGNEMIQPIPEERQKERTFKMLDGFKFTATQEIRLQWHKLNDIKQRESLFIIVNNAPFDVLTGSKQLKDETAQSVLFLFNRHKPKEESQEDKEDERIKEEANQEKIKEQLAETERIQEQEIVPGLFSRSRTKSFGKKGTKNAKK